MNRRATQKWILTRPGKAGALRNPLPLSCVWLVIGLFLVSSAHAQQRTQLTPDSEPATLREQLAQASREYTATLGQLLELYEANAKRTEEQLQKMKDLYAQRLVTRSDMETAEVVAERAREKVVEAQSQLKGAGVQLAEALIEVESEETAPKPKLSPAPRAMGGFVRTTAYIRYGGGRAWSLSEVGAIKQFFIMRFGRPLPIHVFGQSPLHDRWGYDHRNAIDIGLNPDSREGQALVEYLRANGVPFTAFHFAIPGVATGPHIHVGLPSHRITPTVASR